jgi:hypothetical protein
VFRENNIPPMNSSFKESEIKAWKQKVAIGKCYDKLFKKISPNGHETYMTKIIGKVWKDKRNAPKKQVAYAISVCEMILNPNNLYIQVNEDIIKPLITKNFVSL